MEVDLAGNRDGISERFVPDRDHGRLIEVEHLARYQWAAGAARGRRVLDAGCGAAYGCRLLAAGGATSVIGVDIAESVLETVAATMPESVSLRAGDLAELELEGDSFELVVCFEVIEHVADPTAVLDELVRVLAPGGLLLVSSPNRDVYPEGSPHHRHEFRPEELREALAAHLPHVALRRQSDYIVSALLGDASYGIHGGESLAGVALRKLVASAPGDEVYTVALASTQALPELGELALMTGTLELREWLSVFETQTRAIDDKDAHIAALEARLAESGALAAQLLDSEQRLAAIPDLELRIGDLQHALNLARAGAEDAREQVTQLDRRLMDSERVLVDVLGSPSWQITKPLRAAKKLLKR